jgi:hypothetical protein
MPFKHYSPPLSSFGVVLMAQCFLAIGVVMSNEKTVEIRQMWVWFLCDALACMLAMGECP